MSCILKMCLNDVILGHYLFLDFYMYFVLIDITCIHVQGTELIAACRSFYVVRRRLYLKVIGQCGVDSCQ
jgi:hypothetical protein